MVEAALYRGTLVSVSRESGTLAIKLRSRKEAKTLQLADDISVRIARKQGSLEDLKPGQRVTVRINRAKEVVRVTVRSESSRRNRRRTSNQSEKSSAETAQAAERAGSGQTAEFSEAGRQSQPATKSPESSAVVWGEFRGPDRNNISRETGLLTNWPAEGPRQLWAARGLGEGYSSVCVAYKTVYTMGNVDDREMVLAVSLESGQPLWSAPTGGRATRQNAGNGPRGTPTIDGERLYALGVDGDLVCIDLRTQDVVWGGNILRKFNAENIHWGVSESVLIDGEQLICTPGGRKATMVALDKQTGDPLWRAAVPGDPRAPYASAIVAEVDGVRQYIAFTSKSVVGVRAEDGNVLWQENSSANGTANCATPIFYQGHVFSASGYGTGGALLRLQSEGNGTNATRVYHTRKMKNHHGGMIVIDDHLYGADGQVLTCLNLADGQPVWRDRSVGKSSIVYADGHLYVRSESGPVALVEATPAGYREKGRFTQPLRSGANSWSHPVVADGKLFLRDMDVLLCYDLTSG
jgi:outer membrane protein assembly factor BamB